jgi:hypothetical protein
MLNANLSTRAGVIASFSLGLQLTHLSALHSVQASVLLGHARFSVPNPVEHSVSTNPRDYSILACLPKWQLKTVENEVHVWNHEFTRVKTRWYLTPW